MIILPGRKVRKGRQAPISVLFLIPTVHRRIQGFHKVSDERPKSCHCELLVLFPAAWQSPIERPDCFTSHSALVRTRTATLWGGARPVSFGNDILDFVKAVRRIFINWQNALIHDILDRLWSDPEPIEIQIFIFYLSRFSIYPCVPPDPVVMGRKERSGG
jgi:hypothetical protein